MYLDIPINQNILLNDINNLILESFKIYNLILEDIEYFNLQYFKNDLLFIESKNDLYLILEEEDFIDKINKNFIKLKSIASSIFDKFISFLTQSNNTNAFINANKSKFLSIKKDFDITGFKYTIPMNLNIDIDKSFLEGNKWNDLNFSTVNISELKNYIDEYNNGIKYSSVYKQFTKHELSNNSREIFVKELYSFFRNGSNSPENLSNSVFSKNEIITALFNYQNDFNLVKKLKKSTTLYYNRVINYFSKLNIELLYSDKPKVSNLNIKTGEYEKNLKINTNSPEKNRAVINQYIRFKAKEATQLSICYNEAFSILIQALVERRKQYISIVKKTVGGS